MSLLCSCSLSTHGYKTHRYKQELGNLGQGDGQADNMQWGGGGNCDILVSLDYESRDLSMNLARDTLLCSWARCCLFTVPLSAQV